MFYCWITEYTCLLCPHLVRIFTHLQVERIASTYILRRYTRNACVETEFDRHDTMLFGPDGDTKARRARSILSDLFKLQRSAIMSETAMQTARSIIANAVNELDKIPHDVSLPMQRTAPDPTASTDAATTSADAAPSSNSPIKLQH